MNTPLPTALDDFQKALLDSTRNLSLVAEVHMALLRVLLNDELDDEQLQRVNEASCFNYVKIPYMPPVPTTFPPCSLGDSYQSGSCYPWYCACIHGHRSLLARGSTSICQATTTIIVPAFNRLPTPTQSSITHHHHHLPIVCSKEKGSFCCMQSAIFACQHMLWNSLLCRLRVGPATFGEGRISNDVGSK